MQFVYIHEINYIYLLDGFSNKTVNINRDMFQ